MGIRKSIEQFKKLGENLVGVEIGTHAGNNAISIFENVSILKLYLIDPYEEYYENGIDMRSVFNTDITVVCKEAKELLKDYKDKIVWIKKESSDALADVPDNVDFIYIDGNHQSDYVRQDIDNYYPKIKNGGVIAGHDFSFGSVRLEVEDFAYVNDLEVHSSILFPFSDINPIHGVDWWIIKK